MTQTKQKSYYKILGTTAKISQRRMKEKYIAAVKKHPPEADPAQFEKIREAYETLKDPVKRKQYDLSRKYGGKIESLLGKAAHYVHENKFQKAVDIYNNVLAIDPTNFAAQSGLMFATLRNDDVDKAFDMFKEVLSSPALEEEGIEQEFIYSVFSKMLVEMDYFSEAHSVLQDGLKLFPNSFQMIEAFAFICIMSDEEERALETVEQGIPLEHEETIDDLDIFITWVLLVTKIERWSLLSKVQTRFRKFLKNLENEEEMEEAFQVLIAEFEEIYEFKLYRTAGVFIDLAKVVNVNNVDLKEDIKEVKKLVRLEKDFYRLFKDESIFPLIHLHATRWYFDDDFHPHVQQIEEEFPQHVIEELEQEKEYFAAGIMKIKKKYPAMYNQFKSRWDALFEDVTQNFNREMKRELKKLV